MELQLKHIAPYLPYELMVQVTYECEIGELCLTAITSQDGSDILRLSNTDFYLNDENDFSAKPILHPLSDLTKLIEHKGEMFVPIDRLGDYGCNETEWTVINAEFRCYISDTDEQIDAILPDAIEHTSFGVIQQLFEWHFDVFGLIESGLAVDINTLKQ